MSLIKNDIELKECTFEDFKRVYEYDFSKLTNIWQDIEYVKNSPERIKELFDGINSELENQNNIESSIKKFNKETVIKEWINIIEK